MSGRSATKAAGVHATLSPPTVAAIEADRRQAESAAAVVSASLAARVDAEISAAETPADAGLIAAAVFADIIDRRRPTALRVRARRSGYRRGGRPWPDQGYADLIPGDLSAEQVLAVLDDPVLIIDGEFEAGWSQLPPEIRADFAAAIREHLEDTAED